MFQLKTNFGITFTPLCVFGSNRKYGQMENQLQFDRKITHFSYKTNFAFILPSNELQDSQRERARAHPQNPDHASPQPSSSQPSQASITPAHCPNHAPAKHPRPTNTGLPRSQPTPPSSPIHLSNHQPCTNKLRS